MLQILNKKSAFVSFLFRQVWFNRVWIECYGDSSSTANPILGQARLLRNFETKRLRSVFVKPDLTKEERDEHKQFLFRTESIEALLN